MCDLQLGGGIRPNDLTWEPFVQYFVSIAVFAVRFKWSRVQVRFFLFHEFENNALRWRTSNLINSSSAIIKETFYVHCVVFWRNPYLFTYLFIHYSNLAYNTRNSIMNVNLAETLCLGMSLRNKTAVRLLWGINCKPGHLAGFYIDHARKQWQLFCEKSTKMVRNWPRPANYNIFSCFCRWFLL